MVMVVRRLEAYSPDVLFGRLLCLLFQALPRPFHSSAHPWVVLVPQVGSSLSVFDCFSIFDASIEVLWEMRTRPSCRCLRREVVFCELSWRGGRRSVVVPPKYFSSRQGVESNQFPPVLWHSYYYLFSDTMALLISVWDLYAQPVGAWQRCEHVHTPSLDWPDECNWYYRNKCSWMQQTSWYVDSGAHIISSDWSWTESLVLVVLLWYCARLLEWKTTTNTTNLHSLERLIYINMLGCHISTH